LHLFLSKEKASVLYCKKEKYLAAFAPRHRKWHMRSMDTAALRIASTEQRLAGDPCVSAAVAAHAGTGKTKLLVDRLLRLMLSGGDPARILCLTFTKAAAAEMAIRLQRQLGNFVTLDDTALAAALKALEITPEPPALVRARELFARVLDLPGGMRISTIHAFCQSLLRRFPLEARISPHFRVVEDADARAALDAAREAILPLVPQADIDALAGLVSADGFAGLVGVLEHQRERLRPALEMAPDVMRDALRRVAGARAGSEAELIEAAVDWPESKALRAALMNAKAHGSPAVADKAGRLMGWLDLPRDYRVEHWPIWLEELFRQDGEKQALRNFCNDKLHAMYPDIRGACEAEQTRIQAVLDQMRALRTAEASAALLRLAAPILRDYGAAKERSGLVDYDDLIRRTLALLSDGGAAWVKFKLDGGIDHLLLDEVQDTAAEQWAVTDALAEDFFAGEGARGAAVRTVFAVGDTKQSIYSFQGARPEQFATWRARTGGLVKAAGGAWRDAVLDVSFRSTAPVLALVDAVFAAPPGADGVTVPGALMHRVNRTGQAGSVMLWPLAPRPEQIAPEPWTVPAQNHPARSAPEDLVRHLAGWISLQVSGGMRLESANRALRAGDILVLVRRRGDFDRALVRELKKLDVPVAGLDRMVLTEQPAVQDLLALCAALLLPQDDLTLAEMLVSPLGGLTDASLMDLAATRDGTLWDCLRARAAERPDWRAARDFFAALLSRVDYAAPYALLAEALGPLGGRARLFARLGPEAAEPVDELLAKALHYAALHPPSLQGFLHWLDLAGAEVKREAEAAGDTVRIMTVHGAKGLEAPLVILPDTVGLPPDDARLHWTRDARTGVELPLWAPNKHFRCAAIDRLRDDTAAARAEEYNRLLYVALTRARDHLLVCGWAPRGDVPPASWYALVEAGLRRVGATAQPHLWGQALQLACAQSASAEPGQQRVAASAAPLPAWAGRAPEWRPAPVPPEPALPRPLSPSRPDGIRFGPVPPARSPLRRGMAASASGKGVLVHALLQYLPALPPETRRDAALLYAGSVLPGEAAGIAAQVMAVLEDESLAPLFGPTSRAEQTLTGVAAGQVITGRIDRLAVLPDAILVADYKTSRAPPASADSVPVLYLRQLAAYRAVLRLLYPDRPVRCVLIWTEGPVAMPIPDEVLDRHAPGASPLANRLD
jgi:ATP-dependent helicase/nuclease subunit A